MLLVPWPWQWWWLTRLVIRVVKQFYKHSSLGSLSNFTCAKTTSVWHWIMRYKYQIGAQDLGKRTLFARIISLCTNLPFPQFIVVFLADFLLPQSSPSDIPITSRVLQTHINCDPDLANSEDIAQVYHPPMRAPCPGSIASALSIDPIDHIGSMAIFSPSWCWKQNKQKTIPKTKENEQLLEMSRFTLRMHAQGSQSRLVHIWSVITKLSSMQIQKPAIDNTEQYTENRAFTNIPKWR